MNTEPVELSPLPRRSLEQLEIYLETPVPLEAASGTETPHLADSQLGSEVGFNSANDNVTVQELAPVDGGVQAWTFCFCAFILETVVWGFGFRCVKTEVFYETRSTVYADDGSVYASMVSSKVISRLAMGS